MESWVQLKRLSIPVLQVEQSGTNTMPSIVNVYYQYVNLISIKLLHILLIYQLKSIWVLGGPSTP